MKIPCFLKFGLKATILFFAIILIVSIIGSYFFSTPGEDGLTIIFLALLILMKPIFMLIDFSGLAPIFVSLPGLSPFLVISFLYFFVVFCLVGGVLGVVVKKKKEK